MKHSLPELPYAENALEPHVSAETLRFHHGKHHRAYVDKLNELIQGTEFEDMALEDIVANSSEGPIFNNAAQTWNHTFLWHSMAPRPGRPSGELVRAIDRDFGSLDRFQEQFSKAAIGQFGSGWAWLIRQDRDGTLAIEATPNARLPARAGVTPLFTCDVWEHAYYIDYRNERARYLKAFWSVVNWEFVQRNFAHGQGLNTR